MRAQKFISIVIVFIFLIIIYPLEYTQLENQNKDTNSNNEYFTDPKISDNYIDSPKGTRGNGPIYSSDSLIAKLANKTPSTQYALAASNDDIIPIRSSRLNFIMSRT